MFVRVAQINRAILGIAADEFTVVIGRRAVRPDALFRRERRFRDD